MADINLSLILGAALIAMASPGPANLAIAGTSMTHGRKHGLALASGITTGSLIWSTTAALGMGTVMMANAWLFETLRYAGAAYLFYLAIKSACSAMRPTLEDHAALPGTRSGLYRTYLKGLAIHLTNPKAILFLGSIYALGLPKEATAIDLATVVLALGCQSAFVCHLYAMLFGAASIKILTTTANQ